MSIVQNQSEADAIYQSSPLLASVREFAIEMPLEERQLVVRELIVLLRDYYVHLPLKRSSLGIDPVQEAMLLADELQYIPSEMDLFRKIFEILNRLRDRHTSLRLPSPWREMVAYLPFAVESFFDPNGGRHLIVSKVMTDLGDPAFAPGVEITHWNGTSIRREVEALSWISDGANPFARIALALRALTVRPLGYMRQPDEDWVNLTYGSNTGTYRGLLIPWRVYIPGFGSAAAAANITASGSAAILQGVDRNTLIVNSTWQDLFTMGGSSPQTAGAAENAAGSIRSARVRTNSGEYGYIRIFSFDVPDPLAFVTSFANLLQQMPTSGVIIDVRANPGGNIPAGEMLLGLFTSANVTAQPVSFRNTDAIRRLGELSPFARWKRSLAMQLETGEVFSQGFPLTQRTSGPRGVYMGKVVLIIDGLCYSTTDFFTAGMQDNGLATIIGVDPVTGAGGANVWSHDLLQEFASQAGGVTVQFPRNIEIDVAVRRSIRVGPNEGLPVEGLGIFADVSYQMTARDVLGNNEDLINFAAQVLANQ